MSIRLSIPKGQTKQPKIYKIMKNVERTLTNGEVLTVSAIEENGASYYRAVVSSDTSNQGFEGDRGEIQEGETLDTIADELEMWLNDNINS